MTNDPSAHVWPDNQVPAPVGLNLYAGHAALRDALAFHLPAARLVAAAPAIPALLAQGALAGSAVMQDHARLANHHDPVLHTHDTLGARIDEVEFHPSYHALMAHALSHGLHGAAWAGQPGAHVLRAAGFLMATELEPAVLCPVSMTYAAAPALRAEPALHALWAPRLAGTTYDPRGLPVTDKATVTVGMGMTEKQGGSDVRANTTRAERDGSDAWGERWRVTGHKWFFSAPMSDAHLVLAQTDAGPSCFLLPRWLPDGTRNAVRIVRLKDKLGNRANASAEVEFDHAAAWRVGEPGRGIAQILAMGSLTRLDCALGTAGLMRQALVLALHHSSHRRAFGARLIDHPAMANVLADMALESEAATALALRLAAAVDRTEHGQDADGHEAAMRRLLTPVAKFWICKRGSLLAQEAMECLGGNGYIEAEGAGVMARIYREMPVNAIWEGAGNIQALDLLRALKSSAARDALAQELAPGAGRHPAFDRARNALLAQLRPEAGDVGERGARALAQSLALLAQAACLTRHAPAFVFDAFCSSRLDAAPPAVFGTLPDALPLAQIIERAKPESL